ncbi:hypothetical protein ACFLYO_03175 [Chloroflexota bacterium]
MYAPMNPMGERLRAQQENAQLNRYQFQKRFQPLAMLKALRPQRPAQPAVRQQLPNRQAADNNPVRL